VALAAYQAHDRLHVADTREQAAEKMVADWNEQRMQNPEGRTVMLTDSSNEELDRLNKQAQEYRDQAGELGNDRAELPGAPYALAAGDQVIFTKPLFQPGQDRVENGTLGTVKDVKDEHTLTIDTKGAKEREMSVNTKEFNDLRLGYAQHVYKAQGLTANSALTLIGGWQTDRERAYVALTRAREQTNIYTAREDLGRQGMNVEAIDRLAERIAESHAQQASITTPVANRSLTQSQEPKPETAHDLKAGQSIEPGVGAFSPMAPTPRPRRTPSRTMSVQARQKATAATASRPSSQTSSPTSATPTRTEVSASGSSKDIGKAAVRLTLPRQTRTIQRSIQTIGAHRPRIPARFPNRVKETGRRQTADVCCGHRVWTSGAVSASAMPGGSEREPVVGRRAR
jgi:hypothetical protein